jgi:hypothetical protein
LRAKEDPRLIRLFATKERKLAARALAHKMARIGWAVMVRQEDSRALHNQPRPDRTDLALAQARAGTEKRRADRTKKQDLRHTGRASVKTRDGIPGSSPRTGQPTDRDKPMLGHGAMRLCRLDQAAIQRIHEGLQPGAETTVQTHGAADGSRSAMPF